VDTPQPKRHAFSNGRSFDILAHDISAMTEYSLIVEQPMK
jgi:hypothetical protein